MMMRLFQCEWFTIKKYLFSQKHDVSNWLILLFDSNKNCHYLSRTYKLKDKCGLMCTLITQLIIRYTVNHVDIHLVRTHKCGLM